MIIQMRFPELVSDLTTTGITTATNAQATNAETDIATAANAEARNAPASPVASIVPSPVVVNNDEPLRISCGDCRMVKTSVCDDCVVTHLLDRFDAVGIHGAQPVATPGVRPMAPVVLLDGEELSTLRMLQAAGMAPQNRHVARHPAARSAAGLIAV